MIAPIRWEVDRVTMLAKKLSVTKLHLLYREQIFELEERGITIHHFIDGIKRDLQNDHIEVHPHALDNSNLFESVMFEVSRLIMWESYNKSTIYLNMSTAGKREAVACTIAAMYHTDKIEEVFHVSPEEYSINASRPKLNFIKYGMSSGIGDIISIPLLQVVKPNSRIIQVILILYEKGPQSYKLLLQQLEKRNIEGFEMDSDNDIDEKKEQLNRLSKLKRRILKPGAQYFDKNTKVGKEIMIKLSEEGRKIAILSGELNELFSQ